MGHDFEETATKKGLDMSPPVDQSRPQVNMAPELSSPTASGSIKSDLPLPGPVHRLAFIEGMRACAALYVVLGHVTAFVDPSQLEGIKDRSAQWIQTLAHVFGFGHLAVAAFIVISGFCLRWAALHRPAATGEGYGHFMKRRAKRILPAYYGCLALSLLVALTVTPIAGKMPYTQYLPVTGSNVLAHLFLVHNFNPAWMYKINGVLWSIAIEFQIYFFFPLLAAGIGMNQKKGWGLRAIVALLACAIFSALIIGFFPRGMKLYPWFLGFFCLGMIGADLSQLLNKGGKGVVIAMGWIGLACSGVAIVQNALPIWQEMGLAVGVTGLLVLGTQPESGAAIRGIFGFKPVALVGTFSYSLYLVHHPILQVIDILGRSTWDHPFRHFALLLVIGVPIAIGFAYGFAQLFEGRYVRKAIGDLLSPPNLPN